MSQSANIEELDGSELGTVSYWDKTYAQEIKNFKESGDIGEIWFGEDSLLRVVRWFTNSELVHETDPIIDIGCGNGMSLIELAREGFTNLLGVDYSKPAINLAQRISKEEFPFIQYEVLDIITENIDKYNKQFKVAHDKGTYDAVSLNPDDPKSKRIEYVDKVSKILQNNGLFVITSCNWTESELIEHFKGVFLLKNVIPTPQFKFGGKVGSVVTSVIFEKINEE